MRRVPISGMRRPASWGTNPQERLNLLPEQVADMESLVTRQQIQEWITCLRELSGVLQAMHQRLEARDIAPQPLVAEDTTGSDSVAEDTTGSDSEEIGKEEG